MIARNTKTKKTYEGSRTYIASIIGVNRTTIWRWEKQKMRDIEIYNDYEITFDKVKREKQNKGFNLNPQNINKSNNY